MTATTIEEAVARVRQDFLVDPNERQWSDDQIQRALRYALGKCVAEYASAGGMRFTKVLSSQATTAAGVLALASADPLLVLGVAIIDGTTRERLRQVDPSEIVRPDDQIRSVDLHFVPNIAWPDDPEDDDDLVPSTNVFGTFDAFDEWVMARAALDCTRKDKELHASMQRVEADARAAVRALPDVNASPDFAVARSRYGWLAYAVVGTNLQLARMWG